MCAGTWACTLSSRLLFCSLWCRTTQSQHLVGFRSAVSPVFLWNPIPDPLCRGIQDLSNHVMVKDQLVVERGACGGFSFLYCRVTHPINIEPYFTETHVLVQISNCQTKWLWHFETLSRHPARIIFIVCTLIHREKGQLNHRTSLEHSGKTLKPIYVISHVYWFMQKRADFTHRGVFMCHRSVTGSRWRCLNSDLNWCYLKWHQLKTAKLIMANISRRSASLSLNEQSTGRLHRGKCRLRVSTTMNNVSCELKKKRSDPAQKQHYQWAEPIAQG